MKAHKTNTFVYQAHIGISMNKEQEKKLTNAIRTQMKQLRNSSIAGGMRTSLAVVYDIIQKDISDAEKIDQIRSFCETGLGKK